MRRLQLLRCQLPLDRLADAEPGPELRDHVNDAEIEAGLDLNRPFTTRGVGHGLAPVGVEHPANAVHEPLQRSPVEAIGAAEAVHDFRLDVTLFAMADILGEGIVADDRAVLVPALRGPKVHAHAYSVSLP